MYPWREQMESEEMYMKEECKEKDSMREFEHVFICLNESTDIGQ